MFHKLRKTAVCLATVMLAVSMIKLPAFAAEASPVAMAVKARNEYLELSLSNDNSRLELKDLATGHIWRSYVPEAALQNKPNKLWTNQINSICTIEYATTSDTKGNAQSDSSYKYVSSTTSETIENGILIHFNFAALNIRFDISFELGGKSMRVTVPDSSIQEHGKNRLVSLSVLPFFGAAFDSEEGYYLYPNGSGELYRFKEQKYRQNALKEYIIPYYGSDKVDLDETDDFYAMLPAYGVKSGDSAFTNVILEGDADAQLHLVPGGVSVETNRIYNTFLYRQAYSITGSKLSTAGGDTVKNLGTMFETDRVEGDRCCQYVFLSGDTADYSGMANAVREMLAETGDLVQYVSASDQAPMMIDLVGGVTKKSFIFNSFISMTSFDQAQEIVADLLENGVRNLQINYNGWSKNGIAKSPSHYKAAFKLGGKSGLKKFAEYCSEHSVPLNLQVNFVNAVKNKGSFSLNQDTARDPNGYMYTDMDQLNFLLRPLSILQRGDKLLQYLKGIPVAGLTYDKLGNTLYKDQTNKEYSRQKTAESFAETAAKGNQKAVTAQTTGGNLYMLKQTAVVRDITGKKTGIALSDQAVPFYQMVVHGMVNYTGSPVNLYYNTAQQLLEMIEYGFAPYFEITAESPRKLKGTDYEQLFTSEYAQWKDSILKTAKEFEALAEFYSEYMIKHEQVTDTLAAVTYSNGKTIVVNYSQAEAEYQGVKIPKESFRIIGKGR